MLLEDAKVLQQREIQGGYRLLVMAAPAIAPKVQPGQFVHLRVPHLDSAVLRRPFSVYKADRSTLSILYKDVGRGTAAMKALRDGETVSLLGPLGHGFPPPAKDKVSRARRRRLRHGRAVPRREERAGQGNGVLRRPHRSRHPVRRRVHRRWAGPFWFQRKTARSVSKGW